MYRMFFTALLITLCTPLFAQPDTIRYDNLLNAFDGQLLAATRFDGELDVVFNARFTPKEKCRLTGAVIGFSVVKFQPASGNDTLLVYVYEDSSVPPQLIGIGTYKIDLGDIGFPAGNINYINPLSSGARDQMRVDFTPPLRIAPKRDFLIGIALKSKQQLRIPYGTWNGFSVLINPFQQEYQRYNRLQLLSDSRSNKNMPVTSSGNATMFLRALVEYDATLPNTTLTDVGREPEPAAFQLAQNYPNPFHASTGIDFSLHREESVNLVVSDVLGRHVVTLLDALLPAGSHHIEVGVGDLPDHLHGILLATLRTGAGTATRVMTRLR